ncbi:hypothetical protein M885DRAFT_539212 [Pelagophyceae sp. CCMP2097]|nr:hypothetical protein M885DRAFT_539212 [Pelagophyceae sp. CCMP2097]|mmetsp:Transcript_31279/g.105259  ORF Transcript_31279/g.105259 Transcript_31279/m.105259 type:complete len:656 (+) Transcript_31279:42-2009(+)
MSGPKVHPAQEMSWPVRQPPSKRKRIWYTKGPPLCVALATALVAIPVAYAFAFLSFALAMLASVVLLPLVSVASLWLGSFLPESDSYTKILILFYKQGFFKRKVPNARDFEVKRLRPKKQLDLRRVAYALDVSVPEAYEDDFIKPKLSVLGKINVWIEENLHRLPMPLSEQGPRFQPGEDPVEYAMTALGDVYPNVRMAWPEKNSDDALTKFCLFGIGAHRIEVESNGAAKYFVVRTNALASLPVRKGLEAYGGDAYLDSATWRIVKIVRKEKVRRGSGTAWVLKTYALPSAGAGEVEEKLWSYIKFCFRSSLFALVTLVDHLYGVHLCSANAGVVAAREALGSDHALRRFLVPFLFQTISVNDNARNNLISPFSMGSRNFALDEQGLAMAWAAAPALQVNGPEQLRGVDEGLRLGMLLDREVYILHLRSKGIDTPYWRTSLELVGIFKRFVRGYLAFHYPNPGDLRKDADACDFLQRSIDEAVSTSSEATTLFGPETISARLSALDDVEFFDLSVAIIARLLEAVTSVHEQVGTVPAYAQDVSFAAFNWPIGEAMGTKRTAVTQATLMAFTSTPMPMLMAVPGSENDWTHLFLKGADGQTPQPLLEGFAAFQADLASMADRCDAYDNEAESRPFPFNSQLTCTNPRFLECSVSV